ncbi:MAG: Lar family restriction alleviation protein [Acidiferrobacterales bacterium]|nr:Lar family restriction alleviation protein [Acidiferrobacterales bacterium]
MSDLKPCPFCGSDNVMVDNIVLNDCFTAFCGDCISKSTNFPDFNDAVDAWNNRPHENKLKAEAFKAGFYESGDDFNGEWCGDKEEVSRLAQEYANNQERGEL